MSPISALLKKKKKILNNNNQTVAKFNPLIDVISSAGGLELENKLAKIKTMTNNTKTQLKIFKTYWIKF